MELKFKRDTSFRKQFFVPESFAHPAKMDAQLLIWIVERYTQPGETILDPMAGMGTTMLACTLGRNVALVELEEKFCKMCKSNWGKVSAMPQLGYEMGQCNIVQGDARQLEGLLVDKCIFSLPYAEAHDTKNLGVGDGDRADLRAYSYLKESENNISNLPYGQIDKIVTSPPFVPDDQRRTRHIESEESDIKRGYKPMGGYRSYYSQNPDNIGNPGPYGNIERMVGPETGLGRGYNDHPETIGNLKSESYLEAMLQVYQQCHKVLKPQGLMILVTKNFIRDKQVIRLDEDTIKLCQQVGFSFVERHYRKLSTQSFWRTMYHQKYPGVEQIKSEDILVFQRSEGEP